jgi:lysophospholipase L1-like esterase
LPSTWTISAWSRPCRGTIEIAADPPLARVLKKLRAGEPVTILTMGDSLTDKRHWANREVAWVDLLRGRLKDRYGSEVTIINPAIGGTQLRQNLVLMPLWLGRVPGPDLVTIFFGGNGMPAGGPRAKGRAGGHRRSLPCRRQGGPRLILRP